MSKPKMKNYLFVGKQPKDLIVVHARYQPAEDTIPERGTWRLSEFDNKTKDWIMPCFPEVTWGTLKKMTFIGELQIARQQQGEAG